MMNNFLCPTCGSATVIKKEDFPFMCCGVVYNDLDNYNKSLLGTKLKEAIQYIGIPPCGGCNKREDWINRLHLFMKGA